MSALAGAHGKLAEAGFFLALLKRIENDQPVTTDSLDNEVTYFTSALLSACYSVLEHLKCQGKRALRAAGRKDLEDQLEGDVHKALQRNRDLYNQGARGSGISGYGLRHLSVHHKIVDARHHDRTLGTYGSAPYGRLRYGGTRIERRLYMDDPHSEAPVWIVPRMMEHVHELEELVTRWENCIADLDDAGEPRT
jgi:hypothetical protein